MKGIIIIDVPVIDTAEIDEYGMTADLRVYPTIPTNREELFFELKNVEVRPLPRKRGKITLTERTQDIDHLKWQLECNIYGEGYNKCIENILGEENE